jgi:hypothetical protein
VPTEEEMKEADTALENLLPKAQMFDLTKRPWLPFFVIGVSIVIYVCIPALIAALSFRGGLVLLIARVTFVRKDGARASRLRVFWRALVAWSPLLLALGLFAILKPWLGTFDAGLAGWLLVCALGIISMALPNRSLPDRLAGTWPVPR